MFPLESIDIKFVDPYLMYSLLPDCTTEKFVVVSALAPIPIDAFVKVGPANVGLVPNTNAPEPVSPVTAAAKLVEEGVVKNVATPVPKLATPVATGRPVQFVKVPDAGVPNAGLTMIGFSNDGVFKKSVCCATFVPSLHTDTVLPAGMTTVEPPLNVTPFLVVEFEIVAI